MRNIKQKTIDEMVLNSLGYYTAITFLAGVVIVGIGLITWLFTDILFTSANILSVKYMFWFLTAYFVVRFGADLFNDDKKD